MTCFEFRRLILASPREWSAAQEQHRAACAACAALAREVENFESRIQEAALVPVPEALAERVLLRRQVEPRPRALRAWAFAATVVLALGLGLVVWRGALMPEDDVLSAAALGAGHPAVAAIAHVLEDEPRMVMDSRGVDTEMMRAAFARLGLKVPANGTRVSYFDECPMTGGAGRHVVLQTPFGQVTVILVPDHKITSRVLVADRNKTALAGPARAGGFYILVADSIAALKQLEKMLL